MSRDDTGMVPIGGRESANAADEGRASGRMFCYMLRKGGDDEKRVAGVRQLDKVGV